MNSKHSIKDLEKLFLKNRIQLEEKQISQFWRFLNIYNEYNVPYDLSRLFSFEDIVNKHFVDSIFFTKFMELPNSILDIGSGPGFPGLPLKIIFPEKKFILAEPRSKRVDFINIIIKNLKLSNIEVYPHKVSEISFFKVDGVITRALETIDKTLIRTNHFLPKNGKLIFKS